MPRKPDITIDEQTSLGFPPCNGCTLCCLNDVILVHEEMGDDPSQYEVDEWSNLAGHVGYTLKRNKETGHCIYLREGGCSIHHKRPAICKEFDCRGVVRNTNRSERRQALKNGLVTKEVMKRGVELLPTLKL